MSSADELKDKGIELYQQYDYEAAAKAFEQAKEAYTADGKQDMAAEMMVNIGLIHRALNEGQQALDMMQQALRVFQDENDRLRTAQTLGNMGGVYAKMDDKEQAYNCYRQAADIFEELGKKNMYGETLLAMGNLQVKDGKFMDGAATYEVGLENMEKLSVNQKVIKGLLGVRNRFIGTGDKPDAIEGKDETADETTSNS